MSLLLPVTEIGSPEGIWLTVVEAATTCGMPVRTIRDRAAKGRFRIRIESGPGGSQYLIALDSLDEEARRRYWAKQAPPPPALPASTPAPTSEDVLELVKVLDRHGEEALGKAVERAEIAKTALGLQGDEKTTYIMKICADLGVSQRSVYRWCDQYREGGLVGMVDKTKTQDGGGFGSRNLPTEAIRYIQGLKLLKNRPSGLWCLNYYNQTAPAMGWPTVSRATCYRILGEIPPTVKRFARDPKKWDNTDRPSAVRTSEGLSVNEEWVLDHHECDFWAEYRGRAIRPWLTAIMDWATRCLVGWAFAVTPSSNSISQAMSYAIYPKEDLPFSGVPNRAYMDNGVDFKCHRISGSEELVRLDCGPALQGVMQILDIEPHFALAYSPESKAAIERFFGDVARRWSQNQISWCGADSDERPSELTSGAVKRMLVAGQLPKFEDLPRMFLTEFMLPYLDLPSESEALRGKTRLEAYMTYPRAGQGVPSLSVAPLLFGKGAIATVTRQGIKRFGPDYWFWANELAPYIGKKVTVRWDPNDVGTLYVFNKGLFVCAVQNRELLQLRATEEQVGQWMKERARARKHIREEVASRRRTVADVVAEANAAGPNVVTLPLASGIGAGNVTKFTRFEKAAKAIPHTGPKQTPPSARAEKIADQYVRSLADQSAQDVDELAKRRAQ